MVQQCAYAQPPFALAVSDAIACYKHTEEEPSSQIRLDLVFAKAVELHQQIAREVEEE